MSPDFRLLKLKLNGSSLGFTRKAVTTNDHMITIIRMQLSERPFHLTMSGLENKAICVWIVWLLCKNTPLSMLQRNNPIPFLTPFQHFHTQATHAVVG